MSTSLIFFHITRKYPIEQVLIEAYQFKSTSISFCTDHVNTLGQQVDGAPGFTYKTRLGTSKLMPKTSSRLNDNNNDVIHVLITLSSRGTMEVDD